MVLLTSIFGFVLDLVLVFSLGLGASSAAVGGGGGVSVVVVVVVAADSSDVFLVSVAVVSEPGAAIKALIHSGWSGGGFGIGSSTTVSPVQPGGG